MRVIFAGGGTGGHLFPGLAVARELQQRDSMTEILFVGTEQGIEARVLPREGFRLETIPVRGLKGRGIRGLLDAAWGIPAGLLRSLTIIRNFRPDIIIGLGGYASGPVLLAGKLRGLRCAIMEQNLQPGFTNKFLARFVDRVFTSYRESSAYFSGGKVLETGNPVRWRKLPTVKPKRKIRAFGLWRQRRRSSHQSCCCRCDEEANGSRRQTAGYSPNRAGGLCRNQSGL